MKRPSFSSLPVEPWQWFRRVVFGTLLALAGIGLTVAVLDPFQVYHRPFLLKPVFDDPYYMIPGLVRHSEFDSVVVGSSMCQNFRISQLRQEWGWNCIKLTPSGCTPATMRVILDLLAADHPVRRVFAGVDILTYTCGVQEHRTELPGYLYDHSLWNDCRYLWNQTVLTEHLRDLFKANFSRKPRRRYVLDADRMWNWDFEDGTRRYGREVVLAEERERVAKSDVGKTHKPPDLPTMWANFEVNLLKPIRQSPTTTFVLLFPPYSLLAWEKHREAGDLTTLLQFKQEVQERLLGEPNVKMYDFQADEAIVGNYDNYRDSTHFSPIISRLIVEAIAQERYRVTPGVPAANREGLLELLAQRNVPRELQ